MNNRKAQGALEFLTTHVWAFLIILVMIASLAYFGFLRPSRMFPERCQFDSNFECSGYEITYGTDGTDGQVKFQLMNKVGWDVIVDSVNVSTQSVELYGCTFSEDNSTWADRGFRDFNSSQDCNSQNAIFKKGSKGKVSITMTYYKTGASAFKHEVEGEIYSTVR